MIYARDEDSRRIDLLPVCSSLSESHSLSVNSIFPHSYHSLAHGFRRTRITWNCGHTVHARRAGDAGFGVARTKGAIQGAIEWLGG